MQDRSVLDFPIFLFSWWLEFV